MSVGTLLVLDQGRRTWDTDDPATVEAVRAEFDRLVAGGHWAYVLDAAPAAEASSPATAIPSGATAAIVREFDPEAQGIVIARRLVGG